MVFDLLRCSVDSPGWNVGSVYDMSCRRHITCLCLTAMFRRCQPLTTVQSEFRLTDFRLDQWGSSDWRGLMRLSVLIVSGCLAPCKRSFTVLHMQSLLFSLCPGSGRLCSLRGECCRTGQDQQTDSGSEVNVVEKQNRSLKRVKSAGTRVQSSLGPAACHLSSLWFWLIKACLLFLQSALMMPSCSWRSSETLRNSSCFHSFWDFEDNLEVLPVTWS